MLYRKTEETIMHGEVRISVHTYTNKYLRCKKCEVHDRVCKHVTGCTEKHVIRFLILEALCYDKICSDRSKTFKEISNYESSSTETCMFLMSKFKLSTFDIIQSDKSVWYITFHTWFWWKHWWLLINWLIYFRLNRQAAI